MDGCQSKPPFDLNIPVKVGPNTTLITMVRRALALGYSTIALNTEVHQGQFITKKDKSKPPPADNLADFPAPTQLNLSPSDYPSLAERGLTPTILNRLTITMTNNDFMIAYNKSAVAKQYDLLAINCASSPALTALLKSSFRFDLLCFNPDQVVGGLRWSRKLYSECVDRHIHFELSYAPMVRNSEDRRRVMSQALNYQAVGRSRAIVITSEARSPLELRSPGDVSNLGFLLGLKQAQGVDAVNKTGITVHKAAIGRRMGPFRARVEKLEQNNLHLAPDLADINQEEEKLPDAVAMDQSL